MKNDKQSVIKALKRLIPFIFAFILYFAVLLNVREPSLFNAFIKCFPIFCLNIFVLLNDCTTENEYWYQTRIFMGLLFSAIADALLVWPELFIHGMITFAVAHLFYISSLGFTPYKPKIGVILYIICTIALVILVPKLNKILRIGVPIYSILLSTMAWRAIARLYQRKVTWTKVCTAAGGLLWIISDGVLGFHNFHTAIPYSQIIIMTTYYFGQLGITLSILDIET